MTDATPPKAPKAAASKPSTASKAPASKAATGTKAPASKAAAASTAAAPPAPPAAPTAPAPAPAPQPYAPQPYGSAGYPQQYGRRTNTLAIISLVASLVGLILPLLPSIAGIITGHLALAQIKRTGEGGRGLALAGTIIGYVLTGLTLLIGLFYIIFFVAIIGSGVLTPGTVI